MRQQYIMTQEDLDKLLEASQPVAAIALQCGPLSSTQERVNTAWCELGDRMGFDGMTVKPVPTMGHLAFTAEPK